MNNHSGKIRIALIYGSTREGRFCDTVMNWVVAEINGRCDFELELIDPATLDLPQRHLKEESVAIIGLRHRLARADAFIVVTPEYNHSFSAPLKFLIDSAYSEWQAKPVAFVSYGGISGGLRAVEQLRLVFAELHTVTVRNSVSFANVWDKFDSNGNLRDPKAASKSLTTMLTKLEWWASALRNARNELPYEQVA